MTTTGNEPPASTAHRARPTIADLLDLGRPVVLAHTGGEDEFPGSTMFALRREHEGRRRHAGPQRACSPRTACSSSSTTTPSTAPTNGTGKVADIDLRRDPHAGQRLLVHRRWRLQGPARRRTTCTAACAPASGRRRPATPPTTSPSPACASSSRATRRAAEHRDRGQRRTGRRRRPRADRRAPARARPPRRRPWSASFDDAGRDDLHQLEPSVEMSPGFGCQRGFVLTHAAAGRRCASCSSRRGTSGRRGAHAGRDRQVARRRVRHLGVAERSFAGEPGGLRQFLLARAWTG